jgi:hypothetical protein
MRKASTAKKAARKPGKKGAKRPAAKRAAKRAAKKAAPKSVGRAGTVFAYIARLAGEQKTIASKVDDVVAKKVPGVKRAMKWNVPFYGLEGRGWFCAFASFAKHTSVNFFRGVKLEPVPRDGGVKENRRVVYKTFADVDEAQLASWVRQAAALPGWLAPPLRGGASPGASRARR